MNTDIVYAYQLGRASIVLRLSSCPFAEDSLHAVHWHDGRYDADMEVAARCLS